jgi:hypothetical protein
MLRELLTLLWYEGSQADHPGRQDYRPEVWRVYQLLRRGFAACSLNPRD